MPTYNGTAYLIEMLESISAQSRLPEEVVFSDDGSTDNTLDVLQKFAGESPFEVKVLRHKSSGITSNYLNALKSCTGDIICFADQDDVWLPERLSVVESVFLQNEQVAMTVCDSLVVDEQLKSLGWSILGTRDGVKSCGDGSRPGDRRYLKGGIPTLAHALSINAKLLPLILDKPTTISNWCFEEWVSNMAFCSGKLNFIEKPLTLYRQHSMNSAGAKTDNKEPSRDAVCQLLSRLEKMRFCFCAMQELKQMGRHQIEEGCFLERILLVKEYISFLERRHRVRGGGFHLILSMSVSRMYKRYASGMKSLAKDLYMFFRKSSVDS